MTLAQLLQLYAPFVGLLALAFWTGALSARVRTLEREAKERKDGEAIERTDRDRLVRVEVNTENLGKSVESIERSMQGVQRQLANIPALLKHLPD